MTKEVDSIGLCHGTMQDRILVTNSDQFVLHGPTVCLHAHTHMYIYMSHTILPVRAKHVGIPSKLGFSQSVQPVGMHGELVSC